MIFKKSIFIEKSISLSFFLCVSSSTLTMHDPSFMETLKDAALLKYQENEQLSNCSYTAMRLCECTAECCSCTCYTAAVGAGTYACNPHIKSLYFKNKNASTDEIVLNAALITTYLLGGGWLCSKISQEAASCAEKLKKKNS